MSIQAINWALNLPASLLPKPSQNHLLLILANYANEENVAYPSTATLAKITKLDRRTIQRVLRELEKIGAITTVSAHNIQRKYRKDQTPTAYRLNRRSDKATTITPEA